MSGETQSGDSYMGRRTSGGGWLAVAMITAATCHGIAHATPADTGVIAGKVSNRFPATSPIGYRSLSTGGAGMLVHGTTVSLRTLSVLDSRASQPGDRFNLEVTDDVVIDGVTAIPHGSQATGQVNLVRSKRGWGHSGRLEAGLVSVRAANGGQVLLDGSLTRRGHPGGFGMAAFILLTPVPILSIPLFGHLITGTSAVIPAGTTISGSTHSDYALGPIEAGTAYASIGPELPGADITATTVPVAARPIMVAVNDTGAQRRGAPEAAAYSPIGSALVVYGGPRREIGRDDYHYPSPTDATPVVITIHYWGRD